MYNFSIQGVDETVNSLSMREALDKQCELSYIRSILWLDTVKVFLLSRISFCTLLSEQFSMPSFIMFG